MSVTNIRTHFPQKGEIYFLDCNVLMYIFYVNGTYSQNLISDYSSFVNSIVKANAEIVITDVLISEFINTYIQTEYRRLAELNGWATDKKHFKQVFKVSNYYLDIITEIKYILERQLFPICKRINVDFQHMSMDTIFDIPKTFDFNDRYYGLTAQHISAYIVTNDADFKDTTSCNIITRNRSLLNS